MGAAWDQVPNVFAGAGQTKEAEAFLGLSWASGSCPVQMRSWVLGLGVGQAMVVAEGEKGQRASEQAAHDLGYASGPQSAALKGRVREGSEMRNGNAGEMRAGKGEGGGGMKRGCLVDMDRPVRRTVLFSTVQYEYDRVTSPVQYLERGKFL